jgi:opacity protein-like surface antigen
MADLLKNLGLTMLRNYAKILALFLSIVGIFNIQNALASNQFIYFGVAPTYSNTHFGLANAGANTNTIDNANGVAQLGVFAGYGILIDKIYLGVEGGTQFGKRKASSDTQDFYTQAQLSNTATMSDIYLVDFRPGYIMGDKNSMLYGIIGLNTANFSAVQTSGGVTVQDSGEIRRDGVRLGLGYNLGLGAHFMARVEYVFTKFSNFQFTDTFPDGSAAQTWELNPYSNEISLGLSMIFNI